MSEVLQNTYGAAACSFDWVLFAVGSQRLLAIALFLTIGGKRLELDEGSIVIHRKLFDLNNWVVVYH